MEVCPSFSNRGTNHCYWQESQNSHQLPFVCKWGTSQIETLLLADTFATNPSIVPIFLPTVDQGVTKTPPAWTGNRLTWPEWHLFPKPLLTLLSLTRSMYRYWERHFQTEKNHTCDTGTVSWNSRRKKIFQRGKDLRIEYLLKKQNVSIAFLEVSIVLDPYQNLFFFFFFRE